MIAVCLAAIVAAITVSWLVSPLVRSGHRVWAFAAGSFIALLSLVLYLTLGNPDLPGAPALFEHGPRAERRALTGQELALMEALSEQPQNVDIMLSLASVRMQAGKPADAIVILEAARKSAPDNHTVLLELGAAHFATAFILLNENNQREAVSHLRAALDVAPKDAFYISEINKLIEVIN